MLQCFICKRFGHKVFECKAEGKRQCFKCQKVGHEAKDCWSAASEDVKLSNKVSVVVQKPDDSSRPTETCQSPYR